ncbi:MAG: nickel pincer cofactor biosynthesis protein LarC [Methanobacterium sp.]|nr:nickel pincer cofactor biosynthesis protein LarC [Methanobacterium sp.]
MTVVIDSQNAGIAGNMVLGAFSDLGVNQENLKEIMEYYASYFGDINVKINKIQKSGISATYVQVECKDKKSITYNELLSRLNEIDHNKITPDMLKFAIEVFTVIAEAESQVHKTSLDKVHFHEVGAADAVADVIGAAYCYYQLQLDSQKIYGMPVALGGGRKESAHGSMSIPAPATMEILKNIPVFGGPVKKELTTPTGAALLKVMVDEFLDYYPLMITRKVGYGAGKLDLPFPNTLRVCTGESPIETDKVAILETNVDNVTGEILGHTFKKLMDAGALDVTMIPTISKKNRPGHLLRVITKPENSGKVSEAIIRETGTLGIRILPYVHRNIAERKIIPIEMEIAGEKFKIDIKVGLIDEEIISIAPEYEDARSISDKTGIPLKNIMKKANDEFKKILDEQTLF